MHGLNKTAVEVIVAEVGVDISQQTSKHVDALKNIVFEAVITIFYDARENCPLNPGAKRIVNCGFYNLPGMAHTLADAGVNEETQHNCYRQVRDEIQAFVKTLPSYLKNEPQRE